MKLREMRASWPAGVDPHAPALPYVQDLDVDAMRIIDETLRASAGAGLREVDIAVFSAVQGMLEFHASRSGGEPRDGLRGRPLTEFADEFTDPEREFTDLFLRKHGAAGFDEADVGLFFAVRTIVEFDAARLRRSNREPGGR